jgi:hypothetical protein
MMGQIVSTVPNPKQNAMKSHAIRFAALVDEKSKSLIAAILVLLSSPIFHGNNCYAQTVDKFADIVAKYQTFDINADQIPEINSLETLSFASAPTATINSDDKLLIVLVEDRLLKNEKSFGSTELTQALDEYSQTLNDDEWTVIFLRASLYAGETHQDGRSILALRRFFRDVKKDYPNFAGSVLIGSFPETMLVRRWVWKHDGRSATFNGVKYNQGDGPKATFLAMDPELISHRSDVVLCDLNGNWEDIYVQPKTEIDLIKLLPPESITSLDQWPSFSQTIKTDKFSIKKKSFEDFFFIDDCKMQIVEQSENSLTVNCDYQMLRPEVGKQDQSTVNPLAQPDIIVSRINPCHISVNQPQSNLDPHGKPVAVPKSAGSPNRQFVRSPQLEMRLLVEYLQRNIAHRQGRVPKEAMQVATMWTDLQTPSKHYFAKTAEDLGGIKSFPKANAVDFARFVKTPAILKGVSAHSNATCSVLMGGYKQSDLVEETGGNFWFWKRDGEQYVPTYDDPSVRDRVHFALLRTLWENKKLPSNAGCFYIHGGCEAISPLNAATHPYNSPHYGGHGQIAESLLFYGNGLALIGRSKVYFDIPRGFDNAFGVDHGCFGDILTTYFDVEANDKSLSDSVASRNRTYFWSILGDWTLKLKYAAPLKTSIKADPAVQTFIIRPERLSWVSQQIESGNKTFIDAKKKLVQKADQLLQASPVSVTDNHVVPPSGDKRDYMSYGPYWWPDPKKDNGLPFIRRDGKVNPSSREHGSDRQALGEMIDSVEILALAYHFNRNEAHAAKALQFLQTFFLDEEKRMNPNLNFGQAIPGRVTGRGIGIIDTRDLTSVVDSIQLLRESESLTPDQFDKLQDWFKQYLQWLVNSTHGIDERSMKNNHGTWYDVQVVSFALFTEQVELARQTATAALTQRVRAQIRNDGAQPKELVRTKSFSYSSMNLHGLFILARLAEHVEVDLWQYGDPKAQPILHSAYAYLLPHFGSLQFWSHPQLNKQKKPRPPFYLIIEAVDQYPDEIVKDAKNRHLIQLNDLRPLLR